MLGREVVSDIEEIVIDFKELISKELILSKFYFIRLRVYGLPASEVRSDEAVLLLVYEKTK